MADPQLPPQIPVQEPRSNNACIYGCIGAVLLFFVLSAVLVFGVYFVGSSMLEDFTSNEPLTLPETNLTPEVRADLDERVNAFSNTLNNQQGAQTLELSADEVNALVDQMSTGDNIAQYVHVDINDDLLVGQVSLPLDQMNMPGRYLNATATISVSLENGNLYVFLKDIKAGGKAIPEMFMQGFANENMAAEVLRNDPELRDMVAKLESITVRDGRVVLVAKSSPATEAP